MKWKKCSSEELCCYWMLKQYYGTILNKKRNKKIAKRTRTYQTRKSENQTKKRGIGAINGGHLERDDRKKTLLNREINNATNSRTKE